MRVLIRQIARRLRERFSKPRKRQRRGHLDVRRTIRRNAAWGGVPFMTAWKRRHRDKPKIVAICDVSGSVAQVSDFFLLLIHSLHEVVSDVRSFAFSGNLIEVSEVLEKNKPEEAMKQIMSSVGYGSSDYGRSFVDFEKGFMSAITAQTTVIEAMPAATISIRAPTSCAASASVRSGWSGSIRKDGWAGASAIPKCRATRPSVMSCANARRRSNSSAPSPISWRPINSRRHQPKVKA
jgi:hypothetical protein